MGGTMSSDGRSIASLFSGLLDHFSGEKKPPDVPTRNSEPLEGPAQLLDVALNELQKQKAALRQRRTEQSPDQTVTFSAEDLKKSTAQIHSDIRRDILTLHETLHTNLSEQELNTARTLLLELDEIVSGERGTGLEMRLRGAVIRHVIANSAKIAWTTLTSLMERANVTWPEPTGLPPWAEKKDIERAAARSLSEIAEAFFSSSPARSADRMFGIVTVWKANYPEPASLQWRELVIQGVGYGILGRMIVDAADKLRTQADALKAEAVQKMSAETLAVQRALAAGMASACDIDKILENVAELCEEAIPELAWKAVRPTVQQVADRMG